MVHSAKNVTAGTMTVDGNMTVEERRKYSEVPAGWESAPGAKGAYTSVTRPVARLGRAGGCITRNRTAPTKYDMAMLQSTRE